MALPSDKQVINNSYFPNLTSNDYLFAFCYLFMHCLNNIQNFLKKLESAFISISFKEPNSQNVENAPLPNNNNDNKKDDDINKKWYETYKWYILGSLGIAASAVLWYYKKEISFNIQCFKICYKVSKNFDTVRETLTIVDQVIIETNMQSCLPIAEPGDWLNGKISIV